MLVTNLQLLSATWILDRRSLYCHFDETVFPSLGGDKNKYVQQERQELSWSVPTLSHLDPQLNIQNVADSMPERFLILIKWRDQIHQLQTCLQDWKSPKGRGDMTPIMVSQPHKVEVWLRPWFPKGRGWDHLVRWILTKGRKWVWHSLIHSSSISKLVSWDYLWLCPWINIGGRLNDWTNFRE